MDHVKIVFTSYSSNAMKEKDKRKNSTATGFNREMLLVIYGEVVNLGCELKTRSQCQRHFKRKNEKKKKPSVCDDYLEKVKNAEAGRSQE